MKHLCTLLVFLAVSSSLCGEEQPKSADQLWAEALWQSIPSNGASSEQVKALLVAALARTKNKAPVYVTLADVDSGPTRMREMFENIMHSVEDEAKAQASADLKRRLTEVDASNAEGAASMLQDLLGESYRKAVQKKPVWSGIDELSKLMREGSDMSLMYYVAATAEDPTYKVAWYRLARRATGDLGARAVDGFIRSDPDNATPYFMRAAAAIDAGDLAAALASVKVGNAKPACRWHEADLPRDFELSFPDTEEYRELGVNGKRIARSGLMYMLKRVEDAFAFSDSLPPNLRGVAYALAEEGKRLHGAGKLSEAADCLEAICGMGTLLMRVQPRDFHLMVTGLAISGAPLDDLQSIYDAQEDLDKRAHLERFRAARKSFREHFIKAIDAMKPSKDELKLLLTGEKDGLAEERKLLELTLRESGLLEILEENR